MLLHIRKIRQICLKGFFSLTLLVIQPAFIMQLHLILVLQLAYNTSVSISDIDFPFFASISSRLVLL